jgi:death-on-curing protein
MGCARSEPRWISRTVVLTIHADQIRQHGGALGLRDPGLLESALGRAVQRWHYESGADLCALAAAHGVGLAKNHAFLDGNKRTAFQVMYVFLGLNGLRIDAAEPEVVLLMFDVAGSKTGEQELAEWLRHHTGPRCNGNSGRSSGIARSQRRAPACRSLAAEGT